MKIRIKFSKQGAMKFIGHLDTMRYFQKAMRRADVDIRYSEGFSPHQISPLRHRSVWDLPEAASIWISRCYPRTLPRRW